MIRVGLRRVPEKSELTPLWTEDQAWEPDGERADEPAVGESEPELAPDGFRAALLDEIPSLRRFARALVRDRDKADDVVHDALVRALSKWRSFRPGTNLRTWLMAILHHTFISDVRRRRPQGEEPANWDMIRVADHDETVRLQLRDLERGLARLPAEQRTTLLLIVVEGMSYEEAAEVTGVPVGTIRSRLARARQGLKRFLEEAPDAGEEPLEHQPEAARPARARAARARTATSRRTGLAA